MHKVDNLNCFTSHSHSSRDSDTHTQRNAQIDTYTWRVSITEFICEMANELRSTRTYVKPKKAKITTLT